MKMEQSASQTQQPSKTTSTSESTPQHPLAQAVLRSQQRFGLEKYGITLDQVPDDEYNWVLMALEEAMDKNQYLLKELQRMHKINTQQEKHIEDMNMLLARKEAGLPPKTKQRSAIDEQIELQRGW